MNTMIITLDGPAGAGKSSAARSLAARLGWCYIDTGAMYRAVAMVALEQGIPLEDSSRVAALAESIQIVFQDGSVLVDGRDVSAEIRSERITLADGRNVVTEGRDQGSVVFPHAAVKVFLTASPEARASRRHLEEMSRGRDTTFEQILESQSCRDEADRTRPVGALRPAHDAVLLETDSLSCDEVIDCLIALIEARKQSPQKTV